VPELPEVETIRAQLAPVLAGRSFESVEILDERPSSKASVSGPSIDVASMWLSGSIRISFCSFTSG